MAEEELRSRNDQLERELQEHSRDLSHKASAFNLATEKIERETKTLKKKLSDARSTNKAQTAQLEDQNKQFFEFK